MSDFFRGKGFKVIGAVAVLLFGMIIGSLLRNGVSGTVDGLVGVLVTPVRVVTSAVGDFFSDIGEGFESRKSMRERIELLEKEIAELNLKIVDYEQAIHENEQLKALVNLKESNEEMEFVFSSVISRENDPYGHRIGLNKGSFDGVSVGDPVITKDSYLVGYVSKVGITSCTVTTIFDVTANVGVRLSSSREIGVSESTAELSKKNRCRICYLPAESGVARGETVITSGLGGYYPEGLLLGRVEEVYPAEDGLSSEATVIPFVDIEKTKDLFVITDFAGQNESGESD